MHAQLAAPEQTAASLGPGTPKVTSMAAFKRFLAEPGATITKVRHDDSPAAARDPKLWGPRRVEHLQTNAVRLEGGSWLYLEKGSQFRFLGDRVQHDPRGEFTRLLEYELSFTEPLDTPTGSKAGTGGTDRRK